jgi:hypothetical protein
MVCPSGPLGTPHELERAVANAESLGWRVSVGEHALARTGYLAGDDAQRADDFVRAMLDDEIDGIWCLRGGYGAMRDCCRAAPRGVSAPCVPRPSSGTPTSRRCTRPGSAPGS